MHAPTAQGRRANQRGMPELMQPALEDWWKPLPLRHTKHPHVHDGVVLASCVIFSK